MSAPTLPPPDDPAAEDVKLDQYLADMRADAEVVDLHNDFALASSDSDSGADDADDSSVMAARRGATTTGKRARSDDEHTSARREHHNKHTRRCRARLKSKFDALLATLPPSGSREVKHKVHVLDYAMDAIAALDAELRRLEWALALRSRTHLLRWLATAASNAPSLAAALAPPVHLLCAHAAFVYAETWRPTASNDDDDHDTFDIAAASAAADHPRTWFVERAVTNDSPWCPAATVDALARAADTRVASQHVVLDCDALRDAAFSLRPVPFSTPDACHGLPSVLCGGLLIPVPVAGVVARFVALYDVRPRPPDPHIISLASLVATSVANAFSAATHQRRAAAAAAADHKPNSTPLHSRSPNVPNSNTLPRPK